MTESDTDTTAMVKPLATGPWWASAKWRLFLVVSVVSLVADQITKIWARHSLPVEGSGCGTVTNVVEAINSGRCHGKPVPLISGLWEWKLSMNPGSAFGLFSSQDSARIFLSIVGIAIVGWIIWTVHKARPEQKLLNWALALLVGGAVGNLIDRIYFGVVTDFVLWRYENHSWPVFNIADVVLVIGIGLWFIEIYREGKQEKALRRERSQRAKSAGLVKDLTGSE
ncbi:MAG: signal peptidase II [Kofleriaceae bacterium]